MKNSIYIIFVSIILMLGCEKNDSQILDNTIVNNANTEDSTVDDVVVDEEIKIDGEEVKYDYLVKELRGQISDDRTNFLFF